MSSLQAVREEKQASKAAWVDRRSLSLLGRPSLSRSGKCGEHSCRPHTRKRGTGHEYVAGSRQQEGMYKIYSILSALLMLALSLPWLYCCLHPLLSILKLFLVRSVTLSISRGNVCADHSFPLC